MTAGVAILGDGKHARDVSEYFVAIEVSKDFELKAIYSHRKDDAKSMAKDADVDVYYGTPKEPNHSLDALLGRSDIEALIVNTPVEWRVAVIRQAFIAGKHALSAQPIAQDVKTARKMLQRYETLDDDTIWGVGQSSRFLDPVLYGAQQLKALNGNVQTFSVNMHDSGTNNEPTLHQDEGDGRNAEMHAGVHLVAALRFLLTPVGLSITRVVAMKPSFKGTIGATLHLSNGKDGKLNISPRTTTDIPTFEIKIITDKGAFTITDKRLTYIGGGSKDGDKKQNFSREWPQQHGLNRCLAVFAKSIFEERAIEKRACPEEALEDLKIVQAIFESAEEGGAVKAID